MNGLVQWNVSWSTAHARMGMVRAAMRSRFNIYHTTGKHNMILPFDPGLPATHLDNRHWQIPSAGYARIKVEQSKGERVNQGPGARRIQGTKDTMDGCEEGDDRTSRQRPDPLLRAQRPPRPNKKQAEQYSCPRARPPQVGDETTLSFLADWLAARLAIFPNRPDSALCAQAAATPRIESRIAQPTSLCQASVLLC
jgi:hypothetical protein